MKLIIIFFTALALVSCSSFEHSEHDLLNDQEEIIEGYMPSSELGIGFLIDSVTMDTINFSHLVHAGYNQIDCKVCHNQVADDLGKDISCLKCHFEKSIKLIPGIVPLDRDSLIENGIIN